MAAYDLDTAKQKVVDYTTPKYGRGPNSDAEWQQIAQGINYSDGVDDNELQQAYGNADRYAASIGAQPNQGAQPTAPQGPVSPQYSVPVPQNLQSTVGNLFQQQPASPIQSAYQDALLPLIQQAQQPVSITDPQLQPSSETYRATRQRETERARNALAERMGAQGTTGGLDAGVQQLYNREGSDIAGFDANLVKSEMDARRQQLMQGLSLAQASGNADAERQIRTQLALLDSAVSQGQFGQELGFRRSALEQQGQLGKGELAVRLLATLLGNQLGYDTLGSNNAFNLANLNQNSLLSSLGGL